MAEEEKPKEEAPAAGGGKKKLIIIIVAVLLLVGIGVGAFLALGGSKDGEEGEEAAEEEEGGHGGGHGGEHGDAGPAILPLETFIVNLQVKGSFLKIAVQLEFTEAVVPPTVEHDMPKIRDSVIRVISSKLATDILSVEGKDKLREEIKDAVNEVLKSEDVANVFFTEFIVQ